MFTDCSSYPIVSVLTVYENGDESLIATITSSANVTRE